MPTMNNKHHIYLRLRHNTFYIQQNINLCGTNNKYIPNIHTYADKFCVDLLLTQTPVFNIMCTSHTYPKIIQ